VRVESKHTQDTKLLHQGDVVEVPNHESIKVSQYHAGDYFQFADGMIVFNDADIFEVAEVLSRYRSGDIVVKGTSEERISAVIDAKDTETFVSTLPKIAQLTFDNRSHPNIIQLQD
jgi:transmembrane sensor